MFLQHDNRLGDGMVLVERLWLYSNLDLNCRVVLQFRIMVRWYKLRSQSNMSLSIVILVTSLLFFTHLSLRGPFGGLCCSM